MGELTAAERDEMIDRVLDDIGREYLVISDRFQFREGQLSELIKYHYPVGIKSLEKIENEVGATTTTEQLRDALNRYRWGYFTIFEKIKILYGGEGIR